eukprot:CAMPEP_0196707634 /NCGR_PEP_ID=MMETSP1090-20130531/64450_1 /TAXON_ID=37098 /ORGANISM="Isochrysis sp, Strain CCMP1244" /LENGTH=181 /DNA_ID=CAMNT_0042047613 /DNA_START=22 /DNA_END=568 /DNA_ORIENTATION=-
MQSSAERPPPLHPSLRHLKQVRGVAEPHGGSNCIRGRCEALVRNKQSHHPKESAIDRVLEVVQLLRVRVLRQLVRAQHEAPKSRPRHLPLLQLAYEEIALSALVGGKQEGVLQLPRRPQRKRKAAVRQVGPDFEQDRDRDDHHEAGKPDVQSMFRAQPPTQYGTYGRIDIGPYSEPPQGLL